MVTATAKKGRSKVVNKTAVEQISSLLEQLPKKEKQELPLGEAIAEMSETIQAALAKGYSFDELSKMLSEKLGVSVSVWSLRRYLNAALQGAAAGKPAIKSKRGRKAKSRAPLAAVSETGSQAVGALTETSAKAEPEASVATEAPAPEPAAPEAPAPAKKRRTRGSAEAAATAKPRSTRTKSAAAAKTDGGAKTTTRKARSSAPKAKTGSTRGRKKADQ